MAEITASLVKELRDKTGAGMMDCKKALVETGGDLEEAVDFLRKNGLAAAAKKSGRVASEGLVGVATKDGIGALVEINAEGVGNRAGNEAVGSNKRPICVADDILALVKKTVKNIIEPSPWIT